MSEASERLIDLTAEIVSAHVSNNDVAAAEVGVLIQAVHTAFSSLGQAAAAPVAEQREPVVSVRSSIKADAIACLVCGTKNKMLKRHLHVAHGLTPAEYRAEFGLKSDYPMVAPNYAESRRQLAKRIGLGTAANRGARKLRKAAAKPKR